MQSVRLWFSKDDTAKYISHLDLNRVMLRAVNMAKIPMWYTQGFHPHPFITFALPLSVGMRCENDSMDIRVTENIDFTSTMDKLNKSLPNGIKVHKITDIVMKQKEISYAEFDIILGCEGKSSEQLLESVNTLLKQDNIIVSKKTKSGIKDIDIKPHIKSFKLKSNNKDEVILKLILPAGSRININPILFIKALSDIIKENLFYDITRVTLYNNDMKEFI